MVSSVIDTVDDLLDDPLGTATTIAGGVLGAGAEEDASDAQRRASDDATQAILDMYYQTRDDLAPWRETGTGALRELGYMYGIAPFGEQATAEEMQASRDRFMETPGYDFRYDEGVRALDRSASSRGRLMSGGHERELTRYGQGIASAEFGDYANRLASLADIGQTTTTSTGAFGSSAAGAASQTIQDAGTARASGYTGATDQWTNMLEGLSQLTGERD